MKIFDSWRILVTGITSIHGWPIFTQLHKLLPEAFLYGLRPPKSNIPEGGNISSFCITERKKLEKIKKELYKLSHYTATLNSLYREKFSENLEGKKVEEAKETIIRAIEVSRRGQEEALEHIVKLEEEILELNEEIEELEGELEDKKNKTFENTKEKLAEIKESTTSDREIDTIKRNKDIKL